MIVGCGAAGLLHLERWMQVPDARVAAVCDASSDAAMKAAARAQAIADTDWNEALKLDGIQIVDICVPPADHAAIACAALASGRHVLCEKPLARTPAEAQAMLDAAARSGRLLMPGFCHRFHPPIAFAKELVDNDDLGRVVMFRARFSTLLADAGARWISDPLASGGGALLDTACHAIDLFRFLVGEVRSASGRLASNLPGLRVEDSAALVLEGEQGALGVVEASWATPGGRNVVELYGSAGACLMDYDADVVRYKTADMPVWQTRAIEGADRYQREIGHFADAVRGYASLLVTGDDGLRVNEIIAELYASSAR